MQATLNYQPLPTAVLVHNSDAQVKAICGPVGGGKTSIAAWEFYFSMLEADVPYRFAILRESYRQLHDSTRKTWQEWFGAFTRYVKADETLYVSVPNYAGRIIEHEVQLRHARRPEDASNLLSTEYAGIWLEEVVPAYQMSRGVVGAGLSREIFDLAMMRVRQKDAHRPLMLCTFNPPNRHHWTYASFWQPKPDLDRMGYELFRQPARENVANLRAGYYEEMIARLDPELVKRFVEGEVVTLYPGVRVYPECYEQTHIRERLEVVPKHPLVIGFDFGLTPVALIGQVLTGGALRLYREIQLFNAGAKRLAEDLQHELKDPRWASVRELPLRCWGDPAGSARAQSDESTAFEVLAHKGFHIQPGAIDYESRRIGMSDRFRTMVDGQPGILIDQEGCPILTEALLGGYQYPKSGIHISRMPLKNQFSHVANAAEYLVTGEFGVVDAKPKMEPRVSAIEQARAKWDPLKANTIRGKASWMGN